MILIRVVNDFRLSTFKVENSRYYFGVEVESKSLASDFDLSRKSPQK